MRPELWEGWDLQANSPNTPTPPELAQTDTWMCHSPPWICKRLGTPIGSFSSSLLPRAPLFPCSGSSPVSSKLVDTLPQSNFVTLLPTNESLPCEMVLDLPSVIASPKWIPGKWRLDWAQWNSWLDWEEIQVFLGSWQYSWPSFYSLPWSLRLPGYHQYKRSPEQLCITI